MKRYLPISLDINSKPCLVVGGGAVALRKVKLLLEYGALVMVVAPDVTPSLRSLAQRRKIALYQRRFRKTDLKGKYLVFAATNDHAVNRKIFDMANTHSILVNVVDDPALCSFIMPAIYQKGALQVAVSTGGEFPGMAKALRNRIAESLADDVSDFLEALARLRREVISSKSSEREKKRCIGWLCSDESYAIFKKQGQDALMKHFRQHIKRK